jgi:substrate-binding family protein
MSDQSQSIETPRKTGFFSSSTGLKSFAAVAALILILSWVRASPQRNQLGSAQGPGAGPGSADVVEEGPAAADVGAGGQSSSTSSGGGGGGAASGSSAAAAKSGSLECKVGKNGGATDKGVTGSEVRLATTAVLDGPAKTLLSDSVIAINTLLIKTNKAGGICGRILKLNVVNDSFRADDGLRIIKNFISEDYFALPVVPSAEGLGAAILAGEISKGQIPVVGTDGMRKEQYNDPYVWPVAAATVTSMRVMAKYGYENRNTRTFAIIYDSKYKFGVEGKDAFIEQVAKMPGCAPPGGQGPDKSPCMKVIQPLDPEQAAYGSEVNSFNSVCSGGRCDMVAMLLLPDTANKWLQPQPVRANLYTAGAQTLFTDKFANDCVRQIGNNCLGFAVWTGYNPPIGPIATLPGVAAYTDDVRALKPGIDVNNQFVEGAYLGMTVFLEALRKVGPNLTRANLKAIMDSMDHKTDITSTLSWRPGKHSANVRAQAFSMSVSGGTFRGWSNESTGFLLDPAFGG